MVKLMEIATAVSVMAGGVMFVAGEYRKLRAARRCNEALRRTLCGAFAE